MAQRASDFTRVCRVLCRCLVVTALLASALAPFASAQGGKSKSALTPAFCQRDPEVVSPTTAATTAPPPPSPTG